MLLAVVADLTAVPCNAYDVLLRWTVPPESDVAGYRVYRGPASRTYDQQVDVGRLDGDTQAGVVCFLERDLNLGTAYDFAVTAYNSAGMESDYSNEKVLALTSVTPPPVNAGPDQTGSVGNVLTLGSAPTAGVGYFWQQTAGPPAMLSTRTSSSTRFTATAGGTLQFVLTAYDAQGVAAQDVVNVVITGSSTATPTRSATRTSTLTPGVTQTPTRTRTPSSTPTVTQTRGASSTQTPPLAGTPTFTPTGPTSTPIRTATSPMTPTQPPTATRTPTLTLTATRTATQMATLTPTRTFTATLILTQTATVTRTATITPTAVTTSSPVPTRTATPTLRVTATATANPVLTSTSTRTLTATPLPTQTATSTRTLTLTPTETTTATPVRTSTATQTLVLTATTTAAPAQTGTATRTFTPSAIPTETATVTRTSTITPTATTTPSAQATETARQTFTPTGTPTATCTFTPTATAPPASTATPTTPPTVASTITSSVTPTATVTPTDTTAPAPSATPTATQPAPPIDSPTVMPTAISAPTWTITPTDTPTQAPTVTPTDTALPTATPPPTDTRPPAPSETPTETPIVLVTDTPTVTPTETATSTPIEMAPTDTPTTLPVPSSTDTPVDALTPTDTPTLAVPTPTPSETPTPTASPTAGPPDGPNVPLFVASGNSVNVRYLLPPRPIRGRTSADIDPSTAIISGLSSGQGGGLVVASGNASSDGTCDLVVGQTAGKDQRPLDGVEVYRIRPGRPAERMAQLAAFENSDMSSSGDLAVGDVDSSEAGDEIVVGEDGSHRRASRLRIFGGLDRGDLHLLLDFRALRLRAATRRPLSFALGHVSPDSDRSGQDVVVGDRMGHVFVYRLDGARALLLHRFSAFPDPPRGSAHKLAVGDLLPNTSGSQIVVADDGTRQDGLVRVFDGPTGRMLVEFEAFEPGGAPAGVEIWVADVIPAFRGAELIVGQGPAGGRLRVFTLATGVPKHVLDIPDPLRRTTSFWRHLAIGNLVPNMPRNAVVVAQSDPRFPVEVFDLSEGGARAVRSITLSDTQDAIGAIAVGR